MFFGKGCISKWWNYTERKGKLFILTTIDVLLANNSWHWKQYRYFQVTTSMYLYMTFHDLSWPFIVTRRGLFVFGEWWKVILRFVDIGGISGHQLFKRSFWLNVYISIFLLKTKTNNFIINVTVIILLCYQLFYLYCSPDSLFRYRWMHCLQRTRWCFVQNVR
jgi:hypothetical protein